MTLNKILPLLLLLSCTPEFQYEPGMRVKLRKGTACSDIAWILKEQHNYYFLVDVDCPNGSWEHRIVTRESIIGPAYPNTLQGETK